MKSETRKLRKSIKPKVDFLKRSIKLIISSQTNKEQRERKIINIRKEGLSRKTSKHEKENKVTWKNNSKHANSTI